MKCDLGKPQACFNCPYEDCIDSTYTPNKEELAWLYGVISETSENEQKKARRREYDHRYYLGLTEEQKERKRYTSRLYQREHREEIREKRRAYHREYMREYTRKKKEEARAMA